MRFINQIFTALPGETWSNKDMLQKYEPALDALPLSPPELQILTDAVRYNLVGKRTRQMVPGWFELRTFEDRASVFETGANGVLEDLAAQIRPAVEPAGITFDAVLTTTSTGNLMPGLSYRIARFLNPLVRSDSMLLDLGNGR